MMSITGKKQIRFWHISADVAFLYALLDFCEQDNFTIYYIDYIDNSLPLSLSLELTKPTTSIDRVN